MTIQYFILLFPRLSHWVPCKLEMQYGTATQEDSAINELAGCARETNKRKR